MNIKTKESLTPKIFREPIKETLSAPKEEFAAERALSRQPSNKRKNWNTSDISRMRMMGFHKDECIKALDEAKNDISLAIYITQRYMMTKSQKLHDTST